MSKRELASTSGSRCFLLRFLEAGVSASMFGSGRLPASRRQIERAAYAARCPVGGPVREEKISHPSDWM